MPRVKLTAKFVEHATVPATGRLEFWDAALPGFGLRVTDKGARSWVLLYRQHGRKVRYTIGSAAQISLASARELARDALQAVERGGDPAAAKRRERIDGAADNTVRGVGDLFVRRYAKINQPRSWRETERILKIDVYSRIGDRPFQNVRKPDVLALLDELGDVRQVRQGANGKRHHGGPMAARNAHKVLRKLFRWACDDRGIIESNPIAGIRTPAPDKKRDRVLSDDEIRALWKSWSTPSPFNDACRVMLLTGQRVQEVARVRRTELERDDLWMIPATRYKTSLPHAVPLAAEVREIIAAQDQIGESDLVFSLTGAALNGWSNAKERMDRESGVESWQLRDLRRTARTLMTRHGVDFFVAERVIGHVIAGVAQVYDRYSYLDEKRRALEVLAAAVTRIVEQPPANVVPLRAATAG